MSAKKIQRSYNLTLSGGTNKVSFLYTKKMLIHGNLFEGSNRVDLVLSVYGPVSEVHRDHLTCSGGPSAGGSGRCRRRRACGGGGSTPPHLTPPRRGNAVPFGGGGSDTPGGWAEGKGRNNAMKIMVPKKSNSSGGSGSERSGGSAKRGRNRAVRLIFQTSRPPTGIVFINRGARDLCIYSGGLINVKTIGRTRKKIGRNP